MNLVELLAHTFEGERAKRPVRDFEDLFEEKAGLAETKVGMIRSLAGGYEYTTLRENEKLSKNLVNIFQLFILFE